MQAPHCVTATGVGSAQVAQRWQGCAKSATQHSHTGAVGQRRQTAHWPGIRSDML